MKNKYSSSFLDKEKPSEFIFNFFSPLQSFDYCVADESIQLSETFPINSNLMLQIQLTKSYKIIATSLNPQKETGYCFLYWLTIYSYGNQSITLRRGHNFLTLDFTKKSTFEVWLNLLKPLCMQMNFEKKYTIDKILGKGGFAVVYLVHENETTFKYAAKIFYLSSIKKDNAHKTKLSISNEILCLSVASNSTTIKLQEIYEDQLSIILILEYVEGGNALKYIRTYGILDEEESKKFFVCLYNALSDLHSKQILHRDLKLENILMIGPSAPYLCKLADFGLAQPFSQLGDSKSDCLSLCGTPGYIGPELFVHGKYSPKYDIFGFGVVMFVMLTGVFPFAGKDYKNVLKKNLECKFPFDCKEFTNISQNAQNLIKRMTDPNDQNRISLEQLKQHPWLQGVTFTVNTFMFKLKQRSDAMSTTIEYQKKFSINSDFFSKNKMELSSNNKMKNSTIEKTVINKKTIELQAFLHSGVSFNSFYGVKLKLSNKISGYIDDDLVRSTKKNEEDLSSGDLDDETNLHIKVAKLIQILFEKNRKSTFNGFASCIFFIELNKGYIANAHNKSKLTTKIIKKYNLLINLINNNDCLFFILLFFFFVVIDSL